MAKLKDRNRFIPNGFRFFQPETQWEAPRHVSFEAVVNALIVHRQGNPWLTTKHGWPTNFESVANEVDAYNAKLCVQMGWTDYIMEGSAGLTATPFPHPLPRQLKNVAAGASVLVDWLESGAQAVPPRLATSRGAICAACPKNGKGDWTRWFTVPASEAIRRTVEKRTEWNLSTPFDDQLGVCEACLCPLKLKIHLPITQIKQKLDPEVIPLLHESCWITKE